MHPPALLHCVWKTGPLVCYALVIGASPARRKAFSQRLPHTNLGIAWESGMKSSTFEKYFESILAPRINLRIQQAFEQYLNNHPDTPNNLNQIQELLIQKIEKIPAYESIENIFLFADEIGFSIPKNKTQKIELSNLIVLLIHDARLKINLQKLKNMHYPPEQMVNAIFEYGELMHYAGGLLGLTSTEAQSAKGHDLADKKKLSSAGLEREKIKKRIESIWNSPSPTGRTWSNAAECANFINTLLDQEHRDRNLRLGIDSTRGYPQYKTIYQTLLKLQQAKK